MLSKTILTCSFVAQLELIYFKLFIPNGIKFRRGGNYRTPLTTLICSQIISLTLVKDRRSPLKHVYIYSTAYSSYHKHNFCHVQILFSSKVLKELLHLKLFYLRYHPTRAKGLISLFVQFQFSLKIIY